MVFSTEDSILIKNLVLFKGIVGRRLIEVLSMKGWNKNGLDPLLRNVHATGAVDRQPGSERPRSERTAENIANVCIHLTYFAEDGNEIINHSFQILIICKKNVKFKDHMLDGYRSVISRHKFYISQNSVDII